MRRDFDGFINAILFANNLEKILMSWRLMMDGVVSLTNLSMCGEKV
jgi:hypothetical protein